jgi:hypothetical protein
MNLVSIDTQGRSLTRYVTERPRLAVLERTHERSSTRAIKPPEHNNKMHQTYRQLTHDTCMHSVIEGPKIGFI